MRFAIVSLFALVILITGGIARADQVTVSSPGGEHDYFNDTKVTLNLSSPINTLPAFMNVQLAIYMGTSETIRVSLNGNPLRDISLNPDNFVEFNTCCPPLVDPPFDVTGQLKDGINVIDFFPFDKDPSNCEYDLGYVAITYYVPTPTAFWLLGFSLIGLAAMRRRFTT